MRNYELTLRGIILGAILTLIFTASNVYLGLKVGMTFASSIPAVVIAVAVLSFFKNSNILENNMVQTQVSAAGTLSAVIFVVPALFIVGYWSEFPLWQIFMICFCGGTLGVLFTIPLRRAMVVESKLAYPEGVAAAEILKATAKDAKEKDSSEKLGLKEILSGAFLASLVSLFTNGFKVLVPESVVAFVYQKMTFSFSMGYSLALLGAGYLVGLVASVALFIGIFVAWGILVPYFSLSEFDGLSDAGKVASQIWVQKVRLIGTGVIVIAALWTLVQLSKPVYEGMKATLKNAKLSTQQNNVNLQDTDMSFKSIAIWFIITLIGLFITFYSFVLDLNLSAFMSIVFALVGVCVAVFIGFFVAATCGYMAGLVGSSSSPISGIGIIGVIIASLVILGLIYGFSLFNDPLMLKFGIALALFTTSVIIATAAISNDNLQDLKTGFLVGATPFRQQIALIIGCAFGALAIAPVLSLLYQAYGFVGAMPREGMDISQALAAPQANLMATLSTGIFEYNISWDLISIGVCIGIITIIIDKLGRKFTKNISLPPLAVGIGMYLPPAVSMPIVVGGILAFLLKKHLGKKFKHNAQNVSRQERKAILYSSGLIVGESLLGVIIAGITVFSISSGGSESPLALNLSEVFLHSELLSFIIFVGVVAFFYKRMIKFKY